MFTQILTKKIILLLLWVIVCSTLKAQNIDIHFKGIRSANGQIVVKIYKDDKSFEDDKPLQILKYKKTDLVNQEMHAKLSLNAGTYGFALMDDENVNNEMDFSFLGMPEEGFGFSNYYLTGLFKPKFEVFKFTVIQEQKQQVIMKVKYL